ncbi:MAG: NADP-dependent oxidoreductase [Bacteroidota bacterium]
MKAIAIEEFGGRDKLQLTYLETPKPGEGEVLVRIKATSVNPVDYKLREGYLKGRLPHQFPIILGWDMAGIIEGRGHSSRRFDQGEEVWAYARRPLVQNGTYAEYISLPESYLSRKPKGLSFEEAASMPLTGLTAYQSLFIAGQLQSGQKALLIGASGGVGTMAVQLAKIKGAEVFAVSGGKNKEYVMNELQADHFIDYKKDQLSGAVDEKVDVVFDMVGGVQLQETHKLVKSGGKIVSIAGKFEDIALLKEENKTFHYVFVEPHSRQLDELHDFYNEGHLNPHVNKVFSLEEMKKAHRLIESGHTTGKIAISI